MSRGLGDVYKRQVLVWQSLELCIDGLIIARKVDNIIGAILALSLYDNLKNWIER